MLETANKIKRLNSKIERVCSHIGRQPAELTIVAVSKTRQAPCILAAHKAGINNFGENYVQEALPKIDELAGYKNIIWHFIGRLQSNKAKVVAQNFSWVHSVSSFKLAEKLSLHRQHSDLAPLNVCIQVSITGEGTKGGVGVKELESLVAAIGKLPALKLRGLMTMAAQDATEADETETFQSAHTLFQKLKRQGYPVDTLSMGMSGDYQKAMACGATMLRIGTAIFGARQ